MKRALILSTGIATIWTCAAHAQTAPVNSGDSPNGAAETVNSARPESSEAPQSNSDIVVTGIRRANQVAIDAKKNAINIMDAVGTSEVKALPDTTIVEAVRRIPGLSIIPTTDNEHPQDEAVTPVVRGLGPAYNNVTVDGLEIVSPGTPNTILGSLARGARLDILPASMVSQLQVIKSFTADLDPNAIGGAINIVTRSAYENGGKPFLTMDGALGHNNDVGKPRPQHDLGYRMSATGSTTFGPDHMFGITLSGNYQTIDSYTVEHATADTVYYSFYNAAGQMTSGNTGFDFGNGYAVPRRDTYWYAQNTRTRWGVVGKFELQPSDDFHAFVSGGYFYFQDHYQRNEVTIDPLNYNTVQNQTATTGTYPQADVQIGYIDDHIINKTRMGQVGADWHFADKMQLSFRGGLSYATYDEHYPMFKYSTGNTRPAPGPGGIPDSSSTLFPINYNTSNLNQAFNLPATSYYDLSNYTVLYYRPDVSRQASDRIATGRLDYDYNRGAGDRGLNFSAGASYIDDKPVYGIDRVNWVPNNTGPLLTLQTAAGPTAPLQYNNQTLLTIDPAKALAQYQALPASAFNVTDQTNFNLQDDFRHQEKIFGAYAIVGYRSDDVTAEAGVHLDDTHMTTTGNILNAGVWQPNTNKAHYSYWLPSAIVTWHATPAIDVRGAISRTLGRPSYDSFAARSSVVFGNAASIGSPNATGVTVTLGNPNLKPRLSTNYDLSLEWQASRKYGAFVSLGAFYKDIKDEIFTSSSLGYTYQGVTYANALVSQPLNSSGANIKGVELTGTVNSFGFVHPLLAGFGTTANVSILDGHLKIPLAAGGSRTLGYLVGMPKNIVNASVFYQMNGVELRAAYNHQGKALRATLDAVYWQDLYWAPRDQLDLSATYSLHNGVALYAQAANVTHSDRTSLTGPHGDLLRNTYTVPTTYWVGIRFTPKF